MADGTTTPESIQGIIQQAQKTHADLKEKKQRNTYRQEQLEKELADLKEQLEAKYGTSDLGKLRELFTTWLEEDHAAAVQYQEQIDNVMTQLQAIETPAQAQ